REHGHGSPRPRVRRWPGAGTRARGATGGQSSWSVLRGIPRGASLGCREHVEFEYHRGESGGHERADRLAALAAGVGDDAEADLTVAPPAGVAEVHPHPVASRVRLRPDDLLAEGRRRRLRELPAGEVAHELATAA